MPTTSKSDVSDVRVVGIGASAGGLDALERFFNKLPPDSGAAYVVVQHLSPDFKSHMHELLDRRTSMPVYRVDNGMAVEKNAVYLIPPKKEMIMVRGKLLLTEKGQGLTHPIDVFFRSIAQDCGGNAIGIVLSGTGSDGSRGVREIHEAGGLVLCQSHDSAGFDGMPLSAQATGAVDLVLAPEEMPSALAKYLSGGVAPAALGTNGDGPELEGLDRALDLLKREQGLDFSFYKKSTVVRRVDRRLGLRQVDLPTYLERLEHDADERNALYKDLLIGVTQFFRDPEAFESFEQEVVSPIVERAKNGQTIRGWVAGAATGEEAYSVAMSLLSEIQRSKKSLELKIFATDVHRGSLEIASSGFYSEETLGKVSPERRERFFERTEDGWRVAKELREKIVFAPHNLLQDAPFTHLDFVTCRNLLIYLEPLPQKKLLSLFHFGLKMNGALMLGPSETPRELEDEFEPLDARWRIYRKRRDVRLPFYSRLPPVSKQIAGGSGKLEAAAEAPRHLLPIYDRLLDEHMPPSLLVDERLNLLHAFGGAEEILRLPRGRPTRNVLDLIEGDLKAAIAGAVQHALKGRQRVRYTGIRLGSEGGGSAVLTVMPVDAPSSGGTPLLIRIERGAATGATGNDSLEVDLGEVSRQRVEVLEAELRLTQENLQATIEELETANEELQAANEELVASNEELQSTNEELHSVNEELHSVNSEHQRKIEELTRLTDDMENLLATTEVGVMFLDENLAIRKFTPKLGEIFHVLPGDVGRRIEGFAHTLNHTALVEDLEGTMKTSERVEREVADRDGRRYLLRILLYRSRQRENGVVLTLIDIEGVKAAEDELKRLSAIVNSTEAAVVGKDLDGTIRSWNLGAEKLYGYAEAEAVGRHISLVLPEAEQVLEKKNLQRIGRGEVIEGLELRRIRKDGREVHLRLTLSPVRDERGEVIGASAIGHDITDRKLAEEALARSEQRLRFALDGGRMGTWELDLARGRVWVDENLCEISGLPAETREIDTASWLERVHPADRSRVRGDLESAATGGESYAAEFRIVMPDGRIRWIAGRGSAVQGGGDGEKRLLGVNFDITGAKQAERRLETSHAVARVLAEANTWTDIFPDVLKALCDNLPAELCELWVRGEDGRLTCVESCSSLGEGTPKGFQGRGGAKTFDAGEGLPGRILKNKEPLWLDDASEGERTISASGFRTALGLPILTGAGVDAVITCFSRERQPEDPAQLELLRGLGRQLGQFHSRTQAEEARRKSEQRRRETLDALELFVGLCTPDGTLLEVNQSALELAGLESSDVVGRPLDDTHWFSWSEDVRGQLRRALTRAAAGVASRFDVDVRVDEGRLITLDFQIVPMVDADGRVNYLVPSGIDVTDRRAAERELRKLNDELERRVAERTEKLQRRTAMLQHLSRQLARVEQNERKRLARILHDHLQQLIAAAKIRLDLIEDHITDPPGQEHLRSASASLQEAVRASRTLAAELSPPILETATLAESLKWLVRWVYENHRTNVRLVEEPIPAVSDDTKIFLFQAARELIFNVVKHAEAEHCTLKLSRAGKRRVRMTIEDDGRGFDTDAIHRKVESTGLGLLSLQERLEGLGGRLEIESRPGEGTKLTLTAPALAEGPVPAETPRERETAPREAQPAAARAARDGLVRVLIVDDHRIVREGLASILTTQRGIAVVGEAQDAREAIDLAVALEPDVVLMDVDLPGMNGIDATRVVKSCVPRVEVIGLSIHEEREVAESMKGAGAADFLTKGGRPERLFRRIRELACTDGPKPEPPSSS